MARKPTPVAKAEDKPEDQVQLPAGAADEQAPAQEPETEELDVEQDAEPGTIEARILVDQGEFRCNTLALLTEDQAANCEGWADTSAEAVAYAKSLEA